VGVSHPQGWEDEASPELAMESVPLTKAKPRAARRALLVSAAALASLAILFSAGFGT